MGRRTEQLVLVDVTSSPTENHSPALDAATVKQLKAVGIVYVATHWNAWFKEYWHELELNQGRGSYRLRKTDAGIAAMLRDAVSRRRTDQDGRDG